MALSVATLAGFPAVNSALLPGPPPAPTDAATFTFTNGVYTQGSTQYVAGILDREGVVPSRIFTTNPLPTLVSVTLVSISGQSIQELMTTAPATSFAGFNIVMTPGVATSDEGIYPLGYPVAGGPTGQGGAQAWTLQGGAYTNANAAVGYPQPQLRFFVSFSALLILASTSTG